MPRAVEGWRIVIAAAAVTAIGVAASLASEGPRFTLRVTARLALLLFVAAFVASSAATLAPSPFTRGLLRHRRYLGVACAVVMFGHAVAIAALGVTDPEGLRRVSPLTAVGGAVGYAFLVALTATSFDRTTAWLGRARWRLLHRAGMIFLFLVFLTSHANVTRPVHALFFALLVAALGVRVAAAVRRARRRGVTR